MKALCKVCALAPEWSHRVPRPRRALLVQAAALVLLAIAPQARAQGVTPSAAAALSSTASPADRVYRNGVISPRRWRFATGGLSTWAATRALRLLLAGPPPRWT